MQREQGAAGRKRAYHDSISLAAGVSLGCVSGCCVENSGLFRTWLVFCVVYRAVNVRQSELIAMVGTRRTRSAAPEVELAPETTPQKTPTPNKKSKGKKTPKSGSREGKTAVNTPARDAIKAGKKLNRVMKKGLDTPARDSIRAGKKLKPTKSKALNTPVRAAIREGVSLRAPAEEAADTESAGEAATEAAATPIRTLSKGKGAKTPKSSAKKAKKAVAAEEPVDPFEFTEPVRVLTPSPRLPVSPSPPTRRVLCFTCRPVADMLAIRCCTRLINLFTSSAPRQLARRAD